MKPKNDEHGIKTPSLFYLGYCSYSIYVTVCIILLNSTGPLCI